MANAARKHGLNWGTGRIADLEAGRVSPTLPTLISVALALGEVRGEPIRLHDLLYYDGFVTISGDLVLSGEALIRFVCGYPVEVLVRYIPGGLEEVAKFLAKKDERENKHLAQLNAEFAKVDKDLRLAVFEQSGEAEERAAKALNIDTYYLAIASAYLWGRSLADERDRRSGPGTTAQKRGRITRQLYAELKAAIHGHD